MGRIEDLEREMESIEEQLHDKGCEEGLVAERNDVLEQLDSLAEEGYPEFSDTTELP